MVLPMGNAEICSEGNSTKTPGTNESTSKHRPPPILLTSEANLISLQKELKSVVRGDFFQNTATRTWITTKSMVDYNAMQKFLAEKNLQFLIFYTKADKLVKTDIRHLPGNTSAEDITVALQMIDHDVISVKQMTAKCPTPGVVTHFLMKLIKQHVLYSFGIQAND
jgi:hypothetical protein